MRCGRPFVLCLLVTGALGWSARSNARGVSVDLSGYRDSGGVTVRHVEDELDVSWPSAATGNARGRLKLDLRPGRPLIRAMSVSSSAELRDGDPVTFLLVGTRQAPAGRPPEMSAFNVFFDSPAKRPFQTHRSKLELKSVRVASQGRRTTIALADLSIGPFSGELRLTIYGGTPLLHVESVVQTQEDRRAILYDTGLAFSNPAPMRFTWTDSEGRPHEDAVDPGTSDHSLMVRNRLLVAGADGFSLACFPPPHQFFSPRDLTDNLRTVWYGRGHRGLDDRFGFGIRQSETGGGSFVPWFNAPPGTDQRLGVFYLLSSGSPREAARDALAYTHGDRFPGLKGHRTFTSHWHMAIAMAALDEQKRGTARSIPDFVRMFKELGVDIVHLAEFHGDGHPEDTGKVRLAEMKAMFDECRRLSDANLLLLPGEEANAHLGLAAPGRHPGHWMCLFPKPVYWTMRRAPGQPFAEDIAPFGTIYHVGDRADMQYLLEQESGLAWSSHPRIKASSWAPDIFRREGFYLSDRWLGAAWKAMPADLSHDRLGRRSLDLLDDMANWGQEKYLPGEVDVFKIDHTHELYGHMNVIGVTRSW